LEVVLKEDQSEAEGQAIAEDLMRRLEVREEALLEGAYIDLIEHTINQEQNVSH
jgi:adenylate cyclase class IV